MSAEMTIVGGARQSKRDSLLLSAIISVAGFSGPVTVRVRNLSTGGMMVDGHAAFTIGARILCELRGVGSVAARVAWAEAGRAGVAFDEPIDPKQARGTIASKSVAPAVKLPSDTRSRRPGLKPRA